MKTDFSINVRVDLGLTPRLEQILTSVLGKPGKMSEISAPVVAAPASDEVPQPSAVDAQPEEQAKVEQPKTVKQPSEQDVRDAMHRTRQRIEGEDYKNNTDSDGYQKYHKQLTSQFKMIAAFLGSDKPSTLEPEKRQSFIEQCDELIIEDGKVISTTPY